MNLVNLLSSPLVGEEKGEGDIGADYFSTKIELYPLIHYLTIGFCGFSEI
jgi:hypothetical protein